MSSTRLPERKGGHYSGGNKHLRDRTFTFKMKTPQLSGLVEKSRWRGKGSVKLRPEQSGKITRAKLKEIAERKMEDLLNAN